MHAFVDLSPPRVPACPGLLRPQSTGPEPPGTPSLPSRITTRKPAARTFLPPPLVFHSTSLLRPSPSYRPAKENVQPVLASPVCFGVFSCFGSVSTRVCYSPRELSKQPKKKKEDPRKRKEHKICLYISTTTTLLQKLRNFLFCSKRPIYNCCLLTQPPCFCLTTSSPACQLTRVPCQSKVKQR